SRIDQPEAYRGRRARPGARRVWQSGKRVHRGSMRAQRGGHVGEYLYEHFFGELLKEDQQFRTGPEPGQRMPEADRETVDGERIRIGGPRSKPMLLAFGSLTCPMTHAALPVLLGLYERYGDQIDFVTLYVRECHPGEKIPQPRTFAQKVEYARRLRDDHGIPWTVAVDDLEGTLHRQLDEKPSAAYLVDPRGVVVFR